MNSTTPTALLTGATDGIGKAAAALFRQGGWRVVITARNSDRAAAALAEINASPGLVPATALLGDLGRMDDAVRFAEEFAASHERLDFLFLNANRISQTYERTVDGFEANMALGHLGRALMAFRLERLRSATPGAHILSTVGLNLARIDLDQPAAEAGFTGMKALGWWQWSQQVFARGWALHHGVPFNHFMPGLVRTKILAEEPGIGRWLLPILVRVVGISTEKSASEVVAAEAHARRERPMGAYYSRRKFVATRPLEMRPEDPERLYGSTRRILARWL